MARDAVEMMRRAATDRRAGLRIFEEVTSGVEDAVYEPSIDVVLPGYEPDEIDVIARGIRKRVRQRLSQRARPSLPPPDPSKLLSGEWVEVP